MRVGLDPFTPQLNQNDIQMTVLYPITKDQNNAIYRVSRPLQLSNKKDTQKCPFYSLCPDGVT